MLNLASAPYKAHSREFNILAALLRTGKLSLPKVPSQHLTAMASARPGPLLAEVLHSQASLESLGFSYSEDVILTLSWLTHVELCTVHNNIEQMLKRALGAHQVFKPMYPNFPEQVLLASDAELLVNAWMHYLGDWFGVRVLPLYTEAKRPPLKMLTHLKPTVLALADATAVHDLLIRLINGNASLSESNKALVIDLLSYFHEHFPGRLLEALNERATIPQKEIRALVGGWLLQHSPATFEGAEFARLFKTATDVLRLAAAVCAPNLKTADLTLSAPPRFGKMSRGNRRLLLSLVNAIQSESVLSEMFQRREQWVRLGETLHPGEYQTRFADAFAYFKALRNNEKPASWHGAVENQLERGRIAAVTHLLAQRPGVFARKLHEVLRKADVSECYGILDAFALVAEKVATPVLLQLRQRMQSDLSRARVQAFSPKAGSGRMWVPTLQVERINDDLAELVVKTVDNTLKVRFAKLPELGKVYVDPALEGYSVPFGQRTAQKSLLTLGRGSRVSLGDSAIMRAFMWWNENGVDKDGKPYTAGRIDLDLSCAVLDKSFNYVSHCSFTNLREKGLTHSGDITSAPKGACEFIDIDFSKLPGNAAYIAIVTYAYTRQNFADMPEAYMGWMDRADGQSGAIYDARTVRQKVDLTASGQRVLVGFVDVARREFVWADLVLPAKCGGFNAIETSTDMAGILAKGVVASIRPNIFDLATDHAMARGTMVDNPDEANVVFTSARPGQYSAKPNQKVITAYDADVLANEYLI